MSDLDEDKKRNKLGYQRISIACAHCRRRKIRCVLADGDDQQRCQNCIRLRKECIFYPVDQQNALDNQSQTSQKASSDPNLASGASPSPHESNAGRPFDRMNQFSSMPSLPSNAPPFHGHGLPLDQSEPFPGHPGFSHQRALPDGSSADAGRPGQAQYPFQFQNSNRSQWDTGSPMRSHSRNTERLASDMGGSTWQPPGLQAQFAPYPHDNLEMSHATPAPAYSYAPSQQPGWPVSPVSVQSMSSYASMHDSVQPQYTPTNMIYAQHQTMMGEQHPYAGFGAHRSASQPPVLNTRSASVGMPSGQFQQQQQPFMFQQPGELIDSPGPHQHAFSAPWYSGGGVVLPGQQAQNISPSSRSQPSGTKRSR